MRCVFALRTLLLCVVFFGLQPELLYAQGEGGRLDLSPSRPMWTSVAVPLAQSVAPSPPEDLRITLPGLKGSLYLGAADIDPGGRDAATPGVGVHLEGLVSERTRFTFALVHGYADLLSLLSLTARLGTTARAELLHPKWRLVAGDFVSPADALTGHFVHADGVTFRYDGRVAADVQVGRPKYLGGDSGGHFATARIGVRTAKATVRVVGTTLLRPPAAKIRISIASDAVVESEQDVTNVQRLQALLPPSDSLRAAGFEAEVQPATGHRLTTRAGYLEASGTGRARGFSADARYAVNRPSWTFAATVRRSPGGVAGFPLAGDAATASGTAAVSTHLKAVGHAHWGASPLVVTTRTIRSRGGAAGLQYSSQQTQFAVQAKYMELDSGTIHRTTRTVSLNAVVPSAWVRLSASAELGVLAREARNEPYRVVRGRASLFEQGAVSLGLSGSYEKTGGSPRRVRGDADISWSRGELLLEAGAGYGAGDLLGDSRHVWLTSEVPVGRDMVLSAAVDFMRWDYASSPYLVFLESFAIDSPWRFTVGVRRAFSLPVPWRRATRESRGERP